MDHYSLSSKGRFCSSYFVLQIQDYNIEIHGLNVVSSDLYFFCFSMPFLSLFLSSLLPAFLQSKLSVVSRNSAFEVAVPAQPSLWPKHWIMIVFDFKSKKQSPFWLTAQTRFCLSKCISNKTLLNSPSFSDHWCISLGSLFSLNWHCHKPSLCVLNQICWWLSWKALVIIGCEVAGEGKAHSTNLLFLRVN